MNIAAAKEKSSGGGASRVSLVSNSNTVQKFVLTGGPCGGKTTALERIRVFLSQYGIRVYTVPEAATILWTGGISPSDMKNGDDWVDFQATLMRTQFHLEDTLYTMAEKTGQKSVLLCDRGAMDGKAYVDDSTWAKILAQNNVLEMDICDSRYNAVLHLVTAAHSAEKFFSSETNVTRRETAEEARALDQNILRGWMPHPKQYVPHLQPPPFTLHTFPHRSTAPFFVCFLIDFLYCYRVSAVVCKEAARPGPTPFTCFRELSGQFAPGKSKGYSPISWCIACIACNMGSRT